MAKERSFTIRSSYGDEKIVATPHQAARKAARYAARGTFDRSKRFFDQPEGAHGGSPVKLLDFEGKVLMSCEPSLYPRSRKVHAAARQMFARCEIKPAFKRSLRKRRR